MKKLFFSAVFGAAFLTSQAFACACGASLTDVASSALIPNKKGGLMFLQYDSISQDKNFSGSKRSVEGHNHHKKIDTQMVTLGGQYMFNRDFGLTARVPYVLRQDYMVHHHHGVNEASIGKTKALGDVKITGIYSGLLDDMSLGLIFGAKLPTGETNNPDMHAQMQAGSGSYDAILGLYYKTNISQNSGIFSQIMTQKPIETKHNFAPGTETNFAVGSYYNLGKIGFFDNVSPILQVIGSHKSRDSKMSSDNENSGYKRVFIAPAIEINFDKIKIYGDIELPIYEYVNGNQLNVGKVVKIIVGYNF